MFANFVGIILAILVLISAGAFSYTYLSERVATPQIEAPRQEEIIRERVVATSAPAIMSRPAATAPAPVSKKAPPAKIAAPASANGTLAVTRATTEQAVVAPGPLRVAGAATGGAATTSRELTRDGVFAYTNIARAQNGTLPPLARNETLDRDAQIKLDDMFGRQYFEHISPTGVGPADLAKTVGYAYVIVGENLALGDFGSDEKLVDAWMNSPGHRANILNTHYREIGIAVGKGIFEGRETWLAVQSFGMPLSACPATDATLKAQIESNNAQIATMRAELDRKKAQVEAASPYDPSYNTYVGDFNVLVPAYNTFVESTRTLVADYNAEVRAFNACISSVGTHTEI